MIEATGTIGPTHPLDSLVRREDLGLADLQMAAFPPGRITAELPLMIGVNLPEATMKRLPAAAEDGEVVRRLRGVDGTPLQTPKGVEEARVAAEMEAGVQFPVIGINIITDPAQDGIGNQTMKITEVAAGVEADFPLVDRDSTGLGQGKIPTFPNGPARTFLRPPRPVEASTRLVNLVAIWMRTINLGM